MQEVNDPDAPGHGTPRPLPSPIALLPAIRELAVLALLTIGLYTAIHLLVEPVHVEGFSMEPTLGDQDYLVATTSDYRVHPPSRGDIVVLRGTAADRRDLIKRVIGVPGDHLVIREGRVCVGGRALVEPYLAHPATPAPEEVDEVIPAGQYFVMGDNRDVSMDSRTFGPVGGDRIEARAWLRLLPLARLGPVDRNGPTRAAGPGCP